MAKRIAGIIIAVVSTIGVAFWLYCIFAGKIMGQPGG
jgi:hypothetical protein